MDDFETKKARIQEFRPIDDVFFEVLIRNLKVCQEILRTILEDPGLEVLKVIPQNSVRNLQGRSVRLDAFCKLGNGKVSNIEVQRADDDDHLRRVRYNASCITANVTHPGEKFKNIPYIGELQLEKTFYAYHDKPVLFVCLDAYKNRYLCYRCDYSEMWLIGQVSTEQLVAMMDNKIYLRDMFEISSKHLFVKWDGEITTATYEIPKEAYPLANVFLDLAEKPDVIKYRKQLIKEKT